MPAKATRTQPVRSPKTDDDNIFYASAQYGSEEERKIAAKATSAKKAPTKKTPSEKPPAVKPPTKKQKIEEARARARMVVFSDSILPQGKNKKTSNSDGEAAEKTPAPKTRRSTRKKR